MRHVNSFCVAGLDCVAGLNSWKLYFIQFRIIRLTPAPQKTLHLSLGFCLNFTGMQCHAGVGRCGWSSVNTVQHLLGIILSGLQWPVGRVSEASSGALSALLLPVWPACCPAAQVGGFLMFLQCGAGLPGCPERPFHLLLCRPEGRQPQVSLQVSPGKDTRTLLSWDSRTM